MAHLNKWEDKGLYRQFTNNVTGREVLNINLTIQGDPRFDDIKYVINDFTQITDFDFSDIDIKRLVVTDNAAAKSNPNLKIALILTLEPLLEWANLYCEYMKDSPYICEIFDNISDARKWVSK